MHRLVDPACPAPRLRQPKHVRKRPELSCGRAWGRQPSLTSGLRRLVELRLASKLAMRSPTPADARRWLARFDAVDALHRQEGSRAIDPADSIRLSLSLIAMMFQAAGGQLPADPRRQHDEEAARDVWARLRRARGVGG